jgi:molybdopterin synthase sulfur carrier subunit
MKLTVLFFASLREQVGVGQEEVDVPDGVGTADALRLHLAQRGGAWKTSLDGGKLLRMAVNQDMAKPAAPIKAGDEVAFFPPVTGG